MSEAWTQWQGQIIDGKFLLQQHLGGSGESAVFLALPQPADPRSQNLVSDDAPETVAIRLIADCPNPELQLSRWRMVQGLSHPNLLRVLETGRCRLGEIDLIYAVMEYAEENLGQIIPERALTAEEARQMLDPALDVLLYLHGQGLVHGHLKPANFMAARDELKLASDCICPADEQCAAATDVWSLGVTLAEVLTQHLPVFQENVADPLLPQGLPVEFVEIVRGCMRHDLRLRWTIHAIQERLHAAMVEPTAAVLQPSMPQPSVNSFDPAPTFAEALRPRPVASQRPAPLAMAAAAAAAPAALTEMAASPALSPNPNKESSINTVGRRAEVAAIEPKEDVKVISIQQSAKQSSVVSSASPSVSTAHTLAMPGRPLLATMIAQAKPVVRSTVSQTRLVAQRLVSLASRAILFLAAQVEQALRRISKPRLERAALTGVIVFALASVLYFAFGLLRHKPAADSVREQKTPSPKVIIANQPQRSSSKKHSPAKPSPGKTHVQGQAGSAQAEAQPALQSSSSTQRQTPQPPAAQNVALRSQTQQGIRQIDDGGAEDDAPAVSSDRVSAGVVARSSGADTTVDGIHQILPEVSRSALHTIHGTVRVSVRVRVDPAGNVARAELASAGPSRYFARKSLEAAQNWKFASSSGSPFVVHFEFTHSGTRAFATRVGS